MSVVVSQIPTSKPPSPYRPGVMYSVFLSIHRSCRSLASAFRVGLSVPHLTGLGLSMLLSIDILRVHLRFVIPFTLLSLIN